MRQWECLSLHYWEMPNHAEPLAQKAMELMRTHEIPPTPQNYELWFAYATGQTNDLTQELDAAVGTGKARDVHFAREIHARFFGHPQTDAIDQLGGKLQDEVKRLADILEAAGQDTADFSKTLDKASGELESGDLKVNLKAIVAGVAAATRAMDARNRTLEHQLETSSSEVTTLRKRMETVRQESLLDSLTGLANRRAFDERMQQAIAEARDDGGDVCVMMGDIDHFKKFNDTWGHATGDQVLRLVAQCFQSNVKGRDTAARFGGEEFVVILRQTTLENARTVAEQIRHAVESKKIVKRSSGDSLGSITLSMGVAQFVDGESAADVINRADSCLYAAKHAGRNRVMTEAEFEALPMRQAAHA